MLMRRTAAVLRDPAILPIYVRWLVDGFKSRGGAERRIYTVRMGNFANFSEYLTVPVTLTPEEFQFMKGLHLAGSVAIDIGANMGLVSLTLAHLHPGLTVRAIEPNATTFETLKS